jgi:hypothetical protein
MLCQVNSKRERTQEEKKAVKRSSYYRSSLGRTHCRKCCDTAATAHNRAIFRLGCHVRQSKCGLQPMSQALQQFGIIDTIWARVARPYLNIFEYGQVWVWLPGDFNGASRLYTFAAPSCGTKHMAVSGISSYLYGSFGHLNELAICVDLAKTNGQGNF